MSQQVLPLLPGDATPVGPLAGLVENDDGGVVFVCGLATFAFATGDEVGRKLAAVQLIESKIATVGAVAVAFEVTQATLWRWRVSFAVDGVAGLIPVRKGPKGPSKLTDELAARIRELDAEGRSLAAIGARFAESTATVRVALDRVKPRDLDLDTDIGNSTGTGDASSDRDTGETAGTGDDGGDRDFLPVPPDGFGPARQLSEGSFRCPPRLRSRAKEPRSRSRHAS